MKIDNRYPFRAKGDAAQLYSQLPFSYEIHPLPNTLGTRGYLDFDVFERQPARLCYPERFLYPEYI